MFPFECDRKSGLWCNQKNDNALRAEITNKQRFNMVAFADLSEHINTIQKCEVGLIERCTLEALKLIQPNTALVGQMTNRTQLTGTGKNIKGREAYARMIDPSTGQLLIGFDAYYEYSAETEQSIMPTINEQLFDKLHEKFPITTSTSLSIKKRTAQAKFKLNQLLWPNMPVKVFVDEKRCAIGKIEAKTAEQVIAELAEGCNVKPDQKVKMVTM
jgi:hypothetical protein